MAKVYYQFGIGALRGTIANGVHYPARSRTCGYIRRWVLPSATDQNTILGNIATNLASVWASASVGYKENFKTYAQRYYSTNSGPEGFDPNRSSYAHFIKMMYAWYDSDPTHVDLLAVSKADIVAAHSPVEDLEQAINANLLPPVPNYDNLSSAI